jgi:hypothetical protein
MPKLSLALPLAASPVVRRVAWHVRRVSGQLDRRFFLSLAQGIVVLVAIAAVLITLLEKPLTFGSLSTRSTGGSPPSSVRATPAS